MRDAVIVEAVRAPIGKRNGGLSGMHAVDLSALLLNELVMRAGVEPGDIDDVQWGCVTQLGDQSSNIGRFAVLAAGQKVLARAGLGIDDIGAFEVNEAFAPVPLAWLAETGANPQRLNPLGGGVAIVHPRGA